MGELDFFPGMDMHAEEKIGIVDEVLDIMEKHYELVTMDEHIARLEQPQKSFALERCGR